MSDVPEAAVDIATALADDGAPVVTRPALYRHAKDAADSETVDHGAVLAALEGEGWDYGRHLYFQPAVLAEQVVTVVEDYRERGRLLLTHREVCDRLAEDEDRTDVEGWNKGPFVEHVTEGFAGAGWLTDTIDGSTSRVYVYPLLQAIRDEHPRGRFWQSPAELFGYYLSTSVTRAVEAET